MIKLGLMLIVSSVLLALYTGNFFGFSIAEQKKIEKIKGKTSTNQEEKDNLAFFTTNEFIRRFWKFSLCIGVLIFISGFLL